MLSSGRVDTGTLTFNKGGLGGEKEPAMCCLFPHEGIPDSGQSQRKGPRMGVSLIWWKKASGAGVLA